MWPRQAELRCHEFVRPALVGEGFMRPTLTIDDEIARQLKDIAHQSGRPFTAVVNDVLRAGLEDGRSAGGSEPLPNGACRNGRWPAIMISARPCAWRSSLTTRSLLGSSSAGNAFGWNQPAESQFQLGCDLPQARIRSDGEDAVWTDLRQAALLPFLRVTTRPRAFRSRDAGATEVVRSRRRPSGPASASCGRDRRTPTGGDRLPARA